MITRAEAKELEAAGAKARIRISKGSAIVAFAAACWIGLLAVVWVAILLWRLIFG